MWLAGLAAGMMARAAAGMGVAAEFSRSVAKASLLGSHTLVGNVTLPFLAVNFGRNIRTTSRLMCLAPSALYYPSKVSNSSPYRSSGYLQLGLSVWQGSRTRHAQQVCGVAARAESGNDVEAWVRETNSREPVVVYSKSWCPYCMRVKKLLGSLGYEIEVIELDEDGQPGLQEALETVSGQYTVPNVYIGGKHIGGCDDTVALHSRGQLEPLLQAAGANKK